MKIDWSGLAYNENPDAIAYMLAHPEQIDWRGFSGNPGMFDAELVVDMSALTID